MDWTDTELQELLGNIESVVDDVKDRSYRVLQETLKVKWDEIVIEGKEVQECEDIFWKLFNKVRKMRTAHEILQDMLDKKFLTNFLKSCSRSHTKSRKIPSSSSPFKIFGYKKIDKMREKYPEDSLLATWNRLKKKYLELSDRKKWRWIRKAVKAYEKASENTPKRPLLTKKEYTILGNVLGRPDAPPRSYNLYVRQANSLDNKDSRVDGKPLSGADKKELKSKYRQIIANYVEEYKEYYQNLDPLFQEHDKMEEELEPYHILLKRFEGKVKKHKKKKSKSRKSKTPSKVMEETESLSDPLESEAQEPNQPASTKETTEESSNGQSLDDLLSATRGTEDSLTKKRKQEDLSDEEHFVTQWPVQSQSQAQTQIQTQSSQKDMLLSMSLGSGLSLPKKKKKKKSL